MDDDLEFYKLRGGMSATHCTQHGMTMVLLYRNGRMLTYKCKTCAATYVALGKRR